MKTIRNERLRCIPGNDPNDQNQIFHSFLAFHCRICRDWRTICHWFHRLDPFLWCKKINDSCTHHSLALCGFFLNVQNQFQNKEVVPRQGWKELWPLMRRKPFFQVCDREGRGGWALRLQEPCLPSQPLPPAEESPLLGCRWGAWVRRKKNIHCSKCSRWLHKEGDILWCMFSHHCMEHTLSSACNSAFL